MSGLCRLSQHHMQNTERKKHQDTTAFAKKVRVGRAHRPAETMSLLFCGGSCKQFTRDFPHTGKTSTGSNRVISRLASAVCNGTIGRASGVLPSSIGRGTSLQGVAARSLWAWHGFCMCFLFVLAEFYSAPVGLTCGKRM